MIPCARVTIFLLVASSVSACMATKKAEPEPAKMSLEENGKLVKMSHLDGAPFGSIYDVPREYCRRRGEQDVRLTYPNDYFKPERIAIFYCSNGSATDKAFIENWERRRIAEYNAWVQSHPGGRPLTKEEQNSIAKQNIARLRHMYGEPAN